MPGRPASRHGSPARRPPRAVHGVHRSEYEASECGVDGHPVVGPASTLHVFPKEGEVRRPFFATTLACLFAISVVFAATDRNAATPMARAESLNQNGSQKAAGKPEKDDHFNGEKNNVTKEERGRLNIEPFDPCRVDPKLPGCTKEKSR